MSNASNIARLISPVKTTLGGTGADLSMVNGILRSNGTAFAQAGDSDIAAALNRVTTNTGLPAAIPIDNAQVISARERISTYPVAPASSINQPLVFGVLDQGIVYYTSAGTGTSAIPFNINFVASTAAPYSGAAPLALGPVLNSFDGNSVSFTLMVTNSATATFYPNDAGIQIDGQTVSPLWQGGMEPTSGNPGSVDVYTFVIIRNNLPNPAPSYTLLASQTRFA